MSKYQDEVEEDRFGFSWGPFRVDRMTHDDDVGWVVSIFTPTEEVRVRVSPAGRKTTVDHWRRIEWDEDE